MEAIQRELKLSLDSQFTFSDRIRKMEEKGEK